MGPGLLWVQAEAGVAILRMQINRSDILEQRV